MTTIQLADLAAEVGAAYSGNATISGATHDSRQVTPGDIYIAVPGFTRHGIEFADQAVAAGAVAIASDSAGISRLTADIPHLVLTDVRAQLGLVAAAVHGHPERHLRIVGVTGTNGKSTVTGMVRHILAVSGRHTAIVGTLGTWIGDEHIAGSRTTPEATDLYALLSRMVTRGVTDLVMEVSSHGLTLHRVAGLHFAAAGFTNLTQDHLDFHGTMQNYFDAKAQLFQRCDVAVINVDDEWGEKLRAQCVAADVATVALGAHGDVRMVGLTQSLARGLHIELDGAVSASLDVPVVGEFNAANAAMAVLLAESVGVSALDAANALRGFTGVPGRLEQVPVARGTAFVDYAHTPDAVARVLETLADVGPSRIITVLGCGGDRDPSKREPMGRIAAALSDDLVVTDDNPRSEDPAAIRASVLAGARGGRATVHEVGDRREAIRLALSLAGPHDVVAVLGKGHESGQEVAGIVTAFDDRDVIRQEAAHA